jgi:hypothetical protein
MSRFIAKPLDPSRIDQAFPLVQAGCGLTDRHAWRDFAHRLLAQAESGIRIAEGDHGYLQGLYAYRRLPHPRHGQVFQVDLFLALGLFDPQATMDCLLMDMDEAAALLGCSAVHLHVPQRESEGGLHERTQTCSTTQLSPLAARAIGRGHVFEDVRLCKSL